MSTEVQEGTAGNGDETVLRLRLATLRNNLEQVRDTKRSIDQRRDEITALETVFDQTEGIQFKARYVTENIRDSMRLVDELAKVPGVPQRNVERLSDRLQECARDATEVRKQAKQSANVIAAMAQRWSRLSADNVFDGHIKEIFAKQAGKLIAIIDGLEEEPPDVAWRIYQKDIRVLSEDLFSEYVDLLSGLALRDTGLGDPLTSVAETRAEEEPEANGEEEPEANRAEMLGPDVYVMADDLVKQLYHIGEVDLWHSVAIPARRDAAARTVARMIRLGFPEWTIWAVPLSAYEFGRVVIDKKGKEITNRYASRYGRVGNGFDILLADAFATYALGPSYAFASVYVLLDPSTTDRRGPLRGDSGRAFVVFHMLELMNEEDALTAVLDKLRQQWNMAVEQAKGAPLPAGRDAELLERRTSDIRDFLSENARSIRYSARRWRQVTLWKRLADLVAEGWQLSPGKEDVRDILNAAWHQRLAANPGPTPDLGKDQALAAAALDLWRHDLQTRRHQLQRKGY